MHRQAASSGTKRRGIEFITQPRRAAAGSGCRGRSRSSMPGRLDPDAILLSFPSHSAMSSLPHRRARLPARCGSRSPRRRSNTRSSTTRRGPPRSTVRGLNPLGKIPVLVLEDGPTLFDSRVIVEYLDTVSPVSRLIPEPVAAADRGQALGSARRRRLRRRGRDHPRAQAAGRAAERRLDRAAAAEDRARRRPSSPASSATSPGAAAKRYSLADIAVGCALGYLDLRTARARLARAARQPRAPRREARQATRRSPRPRRRRPEAAVPQAGAGANRFCRQRIEGKRPASSAGLFRGSRRAAACRSGGDRLHRVAARGSGSARARPGPASPCPAPASAG